MDCWIEKPPPFSSLSCPRWGQAHHLPCLCSRLASLHNSRSESDTANIDLSKKLLERQEREWYYKSSMRYPHVRGKARGEGFWDRHSKGCGYNVNPKTVGQFIISSVQFFIIICIYIYLSSHLTWALLNMVKQTSMSLTTTVAPLATFRDCNLNSRTPWAGQKLQSWQPSFSTAPGHVTSQRQPYSRVQLHLQKRKPQPASSPSAHRSCRQCKEIRKRIWIHSKCAC